MNLNFMPELVHGNFWGSMPFDEEVRRHITVKLNLIETDFSKTDPTEIFKIK